MVVLEDLKATAMTRLAESAIDSPGTNVQQKSGLNRETLKTGWDQLDQTLGHKCRGVI